MKQFEACQEPLPENEFGGVPEDYIYHSYELYQKQVLKTILRVLKQMENTKDFSLVPSEI